jgi:hypothetical protein
VGKNMAQKIPFLFLTSVFSAPTEVLFGGSRRSDFSLRLDKLLLTAPDTESAEKKPHLPKFKLVECDRLRSTGSDRKYLYY